MNTPAIKISPSVLAADFSHLAEDVKRIEQSVEYLHLDVMDGVFVPNISFGAPVIASLRKHSALFFDVHLMIVDPIRYVDDFARAGADLITFHYESTDDVNTVIDAIRAKGVKVGISISPETPVDVLTPYIEKVDMVLIMTVRPGFGGQKFMADMMDKVRFVRNFATERGLDLDIQVDGGVSDKNTEIVCAAGANVLVAGSAIFGAQNPAEIATNMKRIGNETFRI